jgi:hypothetical protein
MGKQSRNRLQLVVNHVNLTPRFPIHYVYTSLMGTYLDVFLIHRGPYLPVTTGDYHAGDSFGFAVIKVEPCTFTPLLKARGYSLNTRRISIV